MVVLACWPNTPSRLFKVVWTIWTYKRLVKYIPSGQVCVDLFAYCHNHLLCNIRFCVISLIIPVLMIVRLTCKICSLIYYHNRIRNMIHGPLFRVKLWHNCISSIFCYVRIKSSPKTTIYVDQNCRTIIWWVGTSYTYIVSTQQINTL